METSPSITGDNPVLRNAVVDGFYGGTDRNGPSTYATHISGGNWQSGNNSWAPRDQQRKRDRAFRDPSQTGVKRRKPHVEIENVDKRETLMEETRQKCKSGPKIRFDTISQDRSTGEDALLLFALVKSSILDCPKIGASGSSETEKIVTGSNPEGRPHATSLLSGFDADSSSSESDSPPPQRQRRERRHSLTDFQMLLTTPPPDSPPPPKVLRSRRGLEPITHRLRPFTCDQCPQSFNRNHDLKRHKRIHLAVGPYPCTHCDKSFGRKDALERHIRVKGCGTSTLPKSSYEGRQVLLGGGLQFLSREEALRQDAIKERESYQVPLGSVFARTAKRLLRSEGESATYLENVTRANLSRISNAETSKKFFQCRTEGCPNLGLVYNSIYDFDEHSRAMHVGLSYTPPFAVPATYKTAIQQVYPVPRVHVDRDRSVMIHDVRADGSERPRHSDKDPSIRQEGRYLRPELQQVESFTSFSKQGPSFHFSSSVGPDGFNSDDPHDIFAQFARGGAAKDASVVDYDSFIEKTVVIPGTRPVVRLSKRARDRPRPKPKPVDVSFWA